MSQMNWDREVDVLVVGTGNGGLTAAVCNWEMGTKDVLIIEKQDKVGGYQCDIRWRYLDSQQSLCEGGGCRG